MKKRTFTMILWILAFATYYQLFQIVGAISYRITYQYLDSLGTDMW